MKGLVFTEFLDAIEARYGLETVDSILEDADLPSGGAYTTVGSYPHKELAQLVACLARQTGEAAQDILRFFGEHMFAQLAMRFPELIASASGAFDLLSRVDGEIHVEIRKLYPDADLPVIEFHAEDAGKAFLDYKSHRCLADFAEGMVAGCIRHYGENIALVHENLSGDGGHSRFQLVRQG